MEYMDENSASVAKDALHNYKLDGEGKIKVYPMLAIVDFVLILTLDHICEEMKKRGLCVYIYCLQYSFGRNLYVYFYISQVSRVVS